MHIKNFLKISANKTKLWQPFLFDIGYVILTELNPDKRSMNYLSETLERNIYNTDYGNIWDTSGEIGNVTNDKAYSNQYLAPHTDLNYLPKTPKYQIFTCKRKAKKGGETLLVDGHTVYDSFKFNYPNYYKKLEKKYIFKCSEGKHKYKHKIYDNGIIHHNNYDIINNEDSIEYRLWNNLINSSKIEISLEENETLIVDNHRILHGRNEFIGNRNLIGCYLE
jgi:trimethyllysine dioxygenase